MSARNCDGCTLCCKVMEVAALDKPIGQWCPHCVVGSGCGIYGSRPPACHSFECSYLVDLNLDPAWEPRRSRIVLVCVGGTNRISAHVDPGRPDAWRRAPYYAQLKAWSRQAVAARGQVVAYVGRRATVILPDRDVDLGIMADDEVIVTSGLRTPVGLRIEVSKATRAATQAG